MTDFLETWNEATLTSLGLFWMAFWAFGLGYVISAMIQTFVTKERMKQSMGEPGPKSVGLGTFFGFISSSCSFSALSTTRSLFTKGAGLIPSLAFLLASTNLVVELGIVIAVFLGWQFVVGEYLGGIVLILLMWLLVRLTKPKQLIEKARKRAKDQEVRDTDADIPDWKKLILSKKGWQKVANRYVMEWKMVWKDVTIGFTMAGIIAVFVPQSFFQALFIGSGSEDITFWHVFAQSVVGPIAAFFTFIGSMGNIPLAAVLFGNGVSFAGVMAFIFSDLVVFPVLRIQAKYYGWKMALYILGVFFVILVATALLMHYGFAATGVLPDSSAAQQVTEREFFKIDYTLFFNVAFVLLSAIFLLWKWKAAGFSFEGNNRVSEKVLFILALLAFFWLAVGLLIPVFL
jgi:uncharacterized membrane protein YraQ (UPF0718 family)